ncbi:hypothetical protein [Nocardioides sp. ChNu-99]|uniref:hypothetical protein n=1 Tax=Nocardioides sp. ChNu-99 TaxID=2839897 RepID=UPI00240766D4|nr:hypothetical protein [Nocardioides sp. ChNu-99]MDF9715853.1 hypothetical protein [Nocardioides sp. ChNu-99]
MSGLADLANRSAIVGYAVRGFAHAGTTWRVGPVTNVRDDAGNLVDFTAPGIEFEGGLVDPADPEGDTYLVPLTVTAGVGEFEPVAPAEQTDIPPGVYPWRLLVRDTAATPVIVAVAWGGLLSTMTVESV